MNRPGRILVVDDEASWRNLLTDTLQDAGFKVATAGSIGVATEHLANSFFHVLFLDIRMKEEDANNIEGMQLLNSLVREQNLGPAVKILVLSAHGTTEQMREAFHLKVSDFLAKADYDDDGMVAQVKEIFNQMRINLSLEIHWKQVKVPEQFLFNVELNGKRVKRDDPSLHELSEELEDLLCRLFFDAQSLQVRPLSSGLSGANVLWVKPFYSNGPGEARVVKFGDFRTIDREYQNYLDYVEKFIGGSTLVPNNGLRRTPRLGGIIYKLVGAAGEQTESFGNFYTRSETSEITGVLDRLFFETCKSWYSNPGNQQPVELTTQYTQSLGLTQQKLERALAEGLKSVQGKQTLRFNSLDGDRTFTNPVLLMGNFDFEETTYQCKTHGDLNENNVLVNNLGHSWLIDFDKTGPGHILRDVAEMDCIVRFKLLSSDAATLQERLEMEEALCSARQFTDVEQLPQRLVTNNPLLSKAYATAVHLRTIARRLVLHSHDIKEYNIALFYYSINTIRFYDIPTVQRQHALLSASLLANQLA